MLQIEIPEGEEFDERTNEFLYHSACTLTLEHSLVSISKWESKWKKPFIGRKDKTNEELIDYIRCMTVTPHVDPGIYRFLSDDDLKRITEYIEDPMTATWFSDKNKKSNKKETITSEVIYYMMFANQIPKECEKWHLNRLMTLIRVFGEKNQPPKKMGKNELLNRNRALNEARRAKYNTRG